MADDDAGPDGRARRKEGVMKAMALPQNLVGVAQLAVDPEANLCRSVQRWTMALLLSAFASAGGGLCGLLISCLASAGEVDNAPVLQAAGNWLLVAAFPLALLAAHCLDHISATKKALALARCPNHRVSTFSVADNF